MREKTSVVVANAGITTKHTPDACERARMDGALRALLLPEPPRSEAVREKAGVVVADAEITTKHTPDACEGARTDGALRALLARARCGARTGPSSVPGAAEEGGPGARVAEGTSV